MRLRGITYNRSVYDFGVDDVTVFINNQSVVLARRKNTPILYAQSIVRGDDDGLVYETDFVMDRATSKLVGMVVYIDGFYIWSPVDFSLLPLRHTDGYEFIPNTQMHKLREMQEVRSRIRFGYMGRRFNLDKIVYYKDNELLISVKPSGNPIRLDSVMYGTGVNSGKSELLYGQVLSTGMVVLNEYHPMLKLPSGKVRELEEMDYDDLGSSRNS